MAFVFRVCQNGTIQSILQISPLCMATPITETKILCVSQVIKVDLCYEPIESNGLSSICYMFSCWGEQKIVSFFDNIDPCKTHDHPIQFVCLQERCRQLPLLCIECLPQHKDHRWQTIQNFFSPQVKWMFNSGDSKTAQKIQSASAHVKQLFIEFRVSVTERINLFEQKTSTKLQDIHERSKVVFEGGQGLSQESVSELLQAIEKEKSLEWTQNLKTLLEESIDAVSKTIESLVDDLQKTVGLEWEQQTHLQNQLALKELKDHLHWLREEVDRILLELLR